MLRIPPTSITLSDRDLDEHFHYIDRLQNLRAKGFHKNQILQLYEQQQESLRNQENDDDHNSERTPSCGSVAATQENTDIEDAPATKITSGTSIPLAEPMLMMSASTVRKSSLLRFTQNAASDSPESASGPDVDPTQFMVLPNSRLRTYRPRSETYQWLESEADDDLTAGSLSLRQFSALSIQISPSSLRAEAPPFTPPNLPPPFASSPRASSRYSLPARSRDTTPESIANYALYPRSTPNGAMTPSSDLQLLIQPDSAAASARSPPSTPPRRSSLAYQLLSSDSGSPASSIQLPEPPVTPIRSNQPPQTVPRTYHGHGGPSSLLQIYDDRVSPTQQPQTPADISRHQIVTGREAAYTAPPGSIGRTGRVISNTSPTVRARELHSRWTREYRRARHVEHEQRNEQRPGRASWRDELDLDRVGEENE